MIASLALLGSLLALDQTSLGQFMVSRPLVAGALAGWLLGEPATGLAVGGVLEVLFLPAFPVGGARFPETGPSTVVGTAGAVWTGGAAGLALGVTLGVVWAVAGEVTVRGLRRRNERWVPDPTADAVPATAVITGHLVGLAADALRGLLVTGVGLAVARWTLPVLAAGWPLEGGATLGLLGVVAGFSLGGLVSCYGIRGWRRLALLVGCLAGGAAGALL